MLRYSFFRRPPPKLREEQKTNKQASREKSCCAWTTTTTAKKWRFVSKAKRRSNGCTWWSTLVPRCVEFKLWLRREVRQLKSGTTTTKKLFQVRRKASGVRRYSVRKTSKKSRSVVCVRRLSKFKKKKEDDSQEQQTTTTKTTEH